MVPRAPLKPNREANRQKRAELKLLWLNHPEVKQRVKELCANDFHFWHNHFCWAYDEHASLDSREFPLVEYDFQREMASVLVENIWRAAREPNYRWNAAADKARKMVTTSTILDVLLWFAMFHGISSMITSKTLDDVDILENMDTPFERIRWQLSKQPDWLLPEGFDRNNNEMVKTRLINFQNKGKIVGVAPKGKAVRQGRGLIWFGDEFGFVDETDYEVWDGASGTVKVRLVASTPNGPNCKYARVVFNEDGDNAYVFQLDWWLHPDYAEGLYIKADGTYSSPWFDGILSTNSKQTVAREYLRDHNNSVGGRVFGMFRNVSIIMNLRHDVSRSLFRIWDPGLTFGVIWGHKDRHEITRFYKELLKYDAEAQDVGKTLLDKVAEEVLEITERQFKDFDSILDIGDPASSRKQTSQQQETDYEILARKHGIRVQSAPFYRIVDRAEKRVKLLSDVMTTDIETDEGPKPGMLIDKEGCPTLIKAFEGKYRRVVLSDGTVTDEIDKQHPYCEVVDCAGLLELWEDLKRGGGTTKQVKRTRNRTEWRRSKGNRRYA